MKRAWNEEMRKATLGLSLLAYRKFGCDDEKKISEGIIDGIEEFKPRIGNWVSVWGPAIHRKWWMLFTDALMYVVRSMDCRHEYVVVIRGTNPLSLWSWLRLAFSIGEMAPWPSGNAYGRARISMGASRALDILQNRMKSQDRTILQFLCDRIREAEKDGARATVVFTGHSLGGALAPALALWLKDMLPLQGLEDHAEISAYAYAGPTAGNSHFARYSDRVMKGRCFRFANPLDVAPLAWDESDLAGIFDLYKDGIRPGPLVQLLVSWALGVTRRRGYTQIGELSPLPPHPCPGLRDFLVQAVYQHLVPYVMEVFQLPCGEAVELLEGLLTDVPGLKRYSGDFERAAGKPKGGESR